MNAALSPDVETLVVGGGIIGLAIAVECAKAGEETYVLERNTAIGQETSSRSSEVIHAGIYYPSGCLKARLCVEGKDLLYAYAREKDITFNTTGKLVVATCSAEFDTLRAIANQAMSNGVDDVRFLEASDVRRLEPDISTVGALLSPSTGIIDSYGFLHALATDLEDHGGAIALKTEVQSVTHRPDGFFEIDIVSSGEASKITARNLIACAGLGMAELGPALPHATPYVPPKLHFAKGHYFHCRNTASFRHLIYPVPVDGGLGTHLTLGLDGSVRFGPDVQWTDRIDYAFEDTDGARIAAFERSIRRYWPALPGNALTPDYTGIRPKLSQHGEPPKDFAIHGPCEHGIPRLLALYGIESPGLTSSLAIAKYCRSLLTSSYR